MRAIDLNADLGEGGAEDALLLDLVSSANIACGGHAGDEWTMRKTIDLALAAGVAIGAHPGYEDREHFGRRALTLPLDAVTDFVARQVGEILRISADMGATLHHVKAHGSLYNQADREMELAMAVVKGITIVLPNTMLYAPAFGSLAEAGRTFGLTICNESFADRRYLENGALMPRAEPGAVISNIEQAVNQGLEIATSGTTETICVHSDGPTAVTILQSLRHQLEQRGHTIASKTPC